jgi:hypothetical protein
MQWFPQLLTGASSQYPIQKRRRMRTIRNQCLDGREIKLADPMASSIEWQLKYQELVDAEIASLLDFFVSAEGTLGTFTFLDPTDNLLAWSEKFDEAAWQQDPLLQMSSGVSDPMGSTAAFHVVNPTATPLRLRQTLNVPGGYYYSLSVWARSGQPGEISLLRGNESARRDAGPNWNRLVYAANSGSSESSVSFGIEIAPGAAIDLYGAQAEAQIGASPYKKTKSAGGVYPATRFRDDALTVSMPGPNRHCCTIHLWTN